MQNYEFFGINKWKPLGEIYRTIDYFVIMRYDNKISFRAIIKRRFMGIVSIYNINNTEIIIPKYKELYLEPNPLFLINLVVYYIFFLLIVIFLKIIQLFQKSYL